MDIYKLIHLGAAVISILGFIVRGYWRLTHPYKLKSKFVKIAPHIVDIILLVSATLLILQIEQYPFVHDWLTAKIIALVVYILLGMVTMRFARTHLVQFAAYVGAIITFIYIVSVALTHQVIPIV